MSHQAWYVALATNDPRRLLDMICAGLEPAELTFAAEALGHVRGLTVWHEIDRLLAHESPLVREGAVYAAAKCRADYGAYRGRLQQMAEDDPSAGVRAAAREALE